MERVLFFNYCAVPIFVIILLTTYVRKTTRGLTNRIYLGMTWVCLATSIVSVVAEEFNRFPGFMVKYPGFIIVSYLYFILRSACIVMYLMFIIAYLRMNYIFRDKTKRVLLEIPYYAMLVVLLSNPFHQMMFTVTVEEGYQRGPLFFIIYVASSVYAIMGLYFLFRYKNFIDLSKWLTLLFMYVMIFFSVGTQLLFPDLLVEMFYTSLACLLVCLLVLRPEEITEVSTGLNNWRAYKNELKKITEVGQPFQIIVFRFLNADKVRAYLGEEPYSSYIRCIAERIQHFSEVKKVRWELYYEAPMELYLVLDENPQGKDAAKALPQLYDATTAMPKEVEESGVRLEARLCLIRFPEDLDKIEDIIRLGHDFYTITSFEEKWVDASDIIGMRRYQIENQMDTILNRAIREQRFEVYYQPIFNVKEQRFLTCEALLRLNDEFFGQISPGIFIPAAESKALILPLGSFVLESVFQFISEKNIEALDVEYVEINLSVSQLMQRDLPDLIRYLQEKYRVQPRQVMFEIVETTYDEVGNLVDRNIRILESMGYRFALDDYGIGYSNIQRVFSLPFDIIKLDKILTDTLDTEKGRFIVANVAHMMKDMGKELVIEGVEKEEYEAYLRELGCDYIQGFAYAKPMPGDAFLDFLHEKRLEWQHGDTKSVTDQITGNAS